LFAEYDFERVIHFAAESHVDRSILGPDAFIQTNINGTYQLLEAARGAWRESHTGRLFVHVSTDEVYGSLAPHEAPFTESSLYRPNSPYSASKAAADHLARAWFHTYGLPVVVTNCSNNFGPWQFPEKLIPLMILNAVDGLELPVYGDGLQVRDWLHVEDHCDALHAVIAGGKPGETYVIGGENEKRNIDIVRAICTAVDETLGRSPGTSVKLIRSVPDRLGHDRRYAIDPAKIRTELGWKPKKTFENTLMDVVRWYLDSAIWAKEIRSGEYMKSSR
jgi:dTDP-glucose 4,6-dehydratase